MWILYLAVAVVAGVYVSTELVRGAQRRQAAQAEQVQDLELRVAQQEESLRHFAERFERLAEAVYGEHGEPATDRRLDA